MSEVITITDGYTLNPGDIDWSLINSLGTVNYFDRSPVNTVAERCEDATIIITNKTPVNAETIQKCDLLKIIAVCATGYNIVNIEAARARNVLVCNVPGYGTDSVAQHTFALILELTNHVGRNNESVQAGEWFSSKDFCYTKSPITELSGKTLGIVGYGSIGRKVADIGRSFGMRVVYSRSNAAVDPEAVSIESLFSQSDVVSLHCPLTRENSGFVNKHLLSMMKKTALLINTARGQLINEHDLSAALKEGKLSGAAVDVLVHEPPQSPHPLIGLKNCIVTPHNAWYSREARLRIMNYTFDNIKNALAGKPKNVVNY